MRAKVHSIGLGGVTNLAVLAPVKPGFVAGFESITYLDRLRRLLRALHAARQNVRESELRAPVFADSIGRFGIIQSFRYAIVPPRQANAPLDEPGTWLLSLNVSFDGGWEPYMRVIYRDIGTLLDALFCHCDGYPGSAASFDLYCRWVRDNEVDGGLFYTDSAVTPADASYLSRLERLQRETADPVQADKKIAALALESERQRRENSHQAALDAADATLPLPLRTLKGLYRLSTYFPSSTGDGGVLIRFAQQLLGEFRQVIADPAFVGTPLQQKVSKLFAAELAWLGQHKDLPPRAPPRLQYSDAAIQAALLRRDDPITHGCVVMFGVRDSQQAADHFAKLADLCAVPADAQAVRHHVAFTLAGLQAMHIAPERLDALPQEFAEGMEARCGLLGDVRGNHPDHWLRPLRHCAARPGERIDLSAVHGVVVLRLIDPAAVSPTDLHPRLRQAAEDLQANGTGLAVLALEPLHSRREGSLTKEHFGFVDGISQPLPVHDRAPAPRSDEVRTGELLLGYANDRGDGPFPEQADSLLDNASFLVMRKLRQRLDHVRAALGTGAAADALLARMVGRRQDGAPPVAHGAGGLNDFNFDADGQGAACPFQAHIRRANPRDGRAPLPRILRRGMSYGPRMPANGDAGADADRGIVFMAYCASIAEQFEVIQRWIAGGNSSGVSSSQADPLLAVPQPGEPRCLRHVDAAGRVQRTDLGDKPFVQLHWGLYLFVPSLEALRTMSTFRQPPAGSAGAAAPAAPTPLLETWRQRLEDPDRSPAVWQQVRAQPGASLDAAPYGTLLGSAERVLDVLRDDGCRFSVQGYGQRMQASIGLNHLGMDPGRGYEEQAPAVNQAIEDIGAREAFAQTALQFDKLMPLFMLMQQPQLEGRVRVPLDLVTLSERVLAALCTHWIGLPEDPATLGAGEVPFMQAGGRVDDAAGAAPRCPGHLLSASRFVFTPHPRPEVLAAGPAQGQPALAAVNGWLASGRRLGPLALKIRDGLQHVAAAERDAVVARCIAGVLLGFPPTVHGNFLRTMETWIDDKLLWACQQRLAEVPAEITDRFDRAKQALLEPLLQTMRVRPVPEMLWRCPVVKGEVVHDADRRIVLGIASALADPAAPHELMFGGSRHGATKTLHACPGYGMGLGVLLGLLAGLLEAGTLRPTGSPVLLMLTPN